MDARVARRRTRRLDRVIYSRVSRARGTCRLTVRTFDDLSHRHSAECRRRPDRCRRGRRTSGLRREGACR
ncbi:MAG: hypothetical protein DMD26_02400, partial [Gemmatimonadetes bacterium]